MAPNTGPYWHSSGKGVTPNDALNYYAALKTLTNDELAREQQRLQDEMASSPANRLPALQLVLLAVLPNQTMISPQQSLKFLETARQDADLHQQMADLLILLADRLSSHLTVQAQSKQGSKTLRSTRKKLSNQSDELAICREERDDLANKLQQLQNIERDLLGRER